MTFASDIDAIEPASAARGSADEAHFAIDETYWGYIVRSTEPASVVLSALQLVAWGVGVAFCLATLGLWLMPSGVFSGAVLGMKLGASVMTAAVAAFCLWFASRGLDSEIQIDTKLGEIREVVRNRAGRPSLVGRYGFDAIGRVVIETGSARHDIRQTEGELVLCYRNTDQKLPVARGAAVRLGGLRDRIGRDLMLSPCASQGSGALMWA